MLRRRGQQGAPLLRHSLLGLLATVALVASAAQVWAPENGPLSLLQTVQSSGPPITMGETNFHEHKALTVGVQGLSSARKKLSDALKPLKDFKRSNIASPPANKVVPEQSPQLPMTLHMRIERRCVDARVLLPVCAK